MPYEIRDFSGSLFRNDKREKDTHAHAKGKAMIGGVMYWVSAWTKTKGDGERWQSLSFTPCEQPKQQGTNVSRPTARVPDSDDSQGFEDCPF